MQITYDVDYQVIGEMRVTVSVTDPQSIAELFPALEDAVRRTLGLPPMSNNFDVFITDATHVSSGRGSVDGG